MIFQQETRNKKPIRIGLDLDGVLAQHALGGLWIWLRKFKEKILKSARFSSYYYPTNFLEKRAWIIIDDAKRPFKDKNDFFASLAKKRGIQLYLVTGRFKFLEKLTENWLAKYRLITYFHQVLINTNDIDPDVFKAEIINDLDLDFFVDDDLELINFLKKRTRARFYWIVPSHKKKSDNNDGRIENCQNVLEALRKIINLLENNL